MARHQRDIEPDSHRSATPEVGVRSGPSDVPRLPQVGGSDGQRHLARDPVMRMQVDLFRHGRTRAIESGALEPLEEDVHALEEHARAMARETRRTLFDPTRNAQDQLRDTEYRKRLTDRQEAERAAKFAQATLREREAEAARLALRDPKPRPNPVLAWAGIVLIAATVAPTFHDSIFIFDDEILSWLLSLAAGGLAGAFIVFAILGSCDTSGERTATGWGGLLAGIVIGVGLGIIRLASAGCWGEAALALGLTVVELGAVLLIEYAARDLRRALADWGRRKRPSDEADAQCEAARTELARWKAKLVDLDDAIGAHLEYVEDRAVRNLKVDDLEAAAVKAVRDGYSDGVGHNRGRVLGVAR